MTTMPNALALAGAARPSRRRAADPSFQPASLKAKRSTMLFPHRPASQITCFVETEERVYKLAHTLAIDIVYRDDGRVEAGQETLAVCGYGDTLREALKDFCEVFDMQYRALAEVPESDVHPASLRYREALDCIVQSAHDRT